ncbi:hypothetical protein C8F01DRAFT_566847 [Mycena amicta]|nr:hypothetical protein C8F01DRAFT_566847 [Mycena amicta]
MTADAMSSDESGDSDDEDADNKFRIRRLPYLSNAAISFKRSIDAVRRREKRLQKPRGNSERLRALSALKSHRESHVPGLPINAYDKSWLNADLTRAARIRAGPEYDFTIPPEVMSML